MAKRVKLIPVLQIKDFEALEAAQEHLGKHGYKTKVGPFSELPEAEHEDWMEPASKGYLFYLDEAKLEPGLEVPAEYFDYEE